jgi:GrpB-like predicted nucleotidyltransferase (UPF0157 family)
VDEIHIEPYDARWPDMYRAEREIVEKLIPLAHLAIEHMGSTAVPGLAAKPVIDIIVLIDDLDEVRPYIPALEASGYSYWADNPDTSKLFLVKGLPPAPRRTHHLHVYVDANEFERHIRFRDILRADANLRHAYEALKFGLAERFRGDREAYTKSKEGFIAAALAGDPLPLQALASHA